MDSRTVLEYSSIAIIFSLVSFSNARFVVSVLSSTTSVIASSTWSFAFFNCFSTIILSSFSLRFVMLSISFGDNFSCTRKLTNRKTIPTIINVISTAVMPFSSNLDIKSESIRLADHTPFIGSGFLAFRRTCAILPMPFLSGIRIILRFITVL